MSANTVVKCASPQNSRVMTVKPHMVCILYPTTYRQVQLQIFLLLYLSFLFICSPSPHFYHHGFVGGMRHASEGACPNLRAPCQQLCVPLGAWFCALWACFVQGGGAWSAQLFHVFFV